jgi:hypothetical protein
LRKLRREGQWDAETAGLLAGIYKAIWLRTHNDAYKLRCYETYLDNYERWGDPFNGINAASMALLCADSAKQFMIAQQVADKLKNKVLNYWDRASLAEAYLLLGKYDQASEWYKSAAAASAGLHQNIAVMRARARRNLKAMGKTRI